MVSVMIGKRYFYVLARLADTSPKTIYTRWGRTECPSSASVVYEGFVTGTSYNYHGGAANLICLPESPAYVQTERSNRYTFIYSAEYETSDEVFNINTQDYDVPCAVCSSTMGSSAMMVPATPSCPNGLNNEYSGYMMTSKEGHGHPTDIICIDQNPEIMLGSEGNGNGALLYFVTAACDRTFMPCDPYKHLVPLSCAVCSY